MNNSLGTALVGLGAFLALLGAAFAQDAEFSTHAWVVFIVLAIATVVMLRNTKFSAAGNTPVDTSGYMDGVIRYGTVITLFWGIVGFLVGVVIASQLAWPELNIEPWFNFGRMRPLHTSAVIFAFGGNALLATSFYVVQRTTPRACSAAVSPGSCSGATSCSS
jgi:cytochrome c oxidase cbb3-type subunit 1